MTLGEGVDRVVMLIYRDGSKFPEQHVVDMDVIEANHELAFQCLELKALAKSEYETGFLAGQEFQRNGRDCD